MTESMTCPKCEGSGEAGTRGMFICEICNGEGTVKDEATVQKRRAREAAYRENAFAVADEDESDEDED